MYEIMCVISLSGLIILGLYWAYRDHKTHWERQEEIAAQNREEYEFLKKYFIGE